VNEATDIATAASPAVVAKGSGTVSRATAHPWLLRFGVAFLS